MSLPLTYLLPTLTLRGHALNFFCDGDTADFFDKAIATCWTWAELAQTPRTQSLPDTEDAMYDYAQVVHARVLGDLRTPATRTASLLEFCKWLPALRLPADLSLRLNQGLREELVHATNA